MARSCGIRLGRRSFELVILEGSSKKAKLVRHIIGELPADVEDPFAEAAAVIREAVKGAKIPTDSVGLAVDTGLGAFRNVRLPFSDRAKIEEVIKYEVENQLPHWSIDDVIVDFIVASSSAVESNLIVTAVPKAHLASQIAACELAGLEPTEVELESTAMVNAAHHAGLFDPESACVLVHFGDSSTSVVVLDGGAVKSMRAVHSGAFPALPPGTTEDPLAREAHLEEIVVRLKRELRRTISASATARPIEAVYVCGHDTPGLVGEQILDVPVEVLQTLPDGSGEGVESPGRYMVAWGAALRQLGGGIVHPSLRREELRFLGKFERLELPLAVLGLLLLTIFSVRTIITHKQIQKQESVLDFWLEQSNRVMLGQPESGISGTLTRPPDKVRDYARNAERGEVEQEGRFAQLRTIETLLQGEVLALQRKMGVEQDLGQPMSALEGSTLVLGVFSDLGPELGPFSLRRIEAMFYSGRGTKPDTVIVRLDVTFRGDGTVEATKRYYAFLNAIREKPWFVDDKPVKETTLDTADGIYVDGLQITVDPSRVERT